MQTSEDPRRAFDKMAGQYQAFRPEYPEESFVELRRRLEQLQADGNSPKKLVVDVGAGTGISTRQLAGVLGPTWRVTGMEPNHDMRQLAQHTPGPSHVDYQDGQAEALPCADGSVSAVVAAQAAQWFRRPDFYAECLRVLHSGGVVCILQNNRDWSRSRMLDDYERFLETDSPGYTRHYRDIDFVAELKAGGFLNVSVQRFSWQRPMSLDEFVGMALSSTKVQAIVRRLTEPAVRARIDGIWRQSSSGTLELPYVTETFLCHRP